METKRKTVRSALTRIERSELAFDVYMRVYEGTESFENGTIGSYMAYLMGAILSPHAEFVQWGEFEERGILEVLRREFPPKHRVWSFIKMEAE